jgi:hypothetical protein
MIGHSSIIILPGSHRSRIAIVIMSQICGMHLVRMGTRFGAGIGEVSLLATVEAPSAGWVLHDILSF